jgi:2'-5' RNA ligase
MRTFIAIELPKTVRAAIRVLIDELSATRANVRWVNPATTHLTVKFLGDADDDAVHGICRAASESVHDVPQFRIECSGVGAFPERTQPRTIWLGVQDPNGALAEVHARVEQVVGPLGFAPEGRPYHPHITLGRRRAGRRWHADLTSRMLQSGNFYAGRVDVEELVVFSSELTPQGPEYVPLTRCRLAD